MSTEKIHKKWNEECVMGHPQDERYYKGYVAGYRDGVQAALGSDAKVVMENELGHLPIKAMKISARAFNCLSQAGCVYIADIAGLSESRIATMRNLGTKTASEIARWLDENGFCYSAWSAYL